MDKYSRYEKDDKIWKKGGKLWRKAKDAGLETPMDYCCKERERNCQSNNSCDEDCTLQTDNKERYLGPDMGFYFKWQINGQGLPRGCPGFEDRRGRGMSDRDFRKKGMVIPDCPKQDADDGTGQELWKTVEEFADSQETWIKEFVAAFEKMQSNGYKSLDQGPTGFWTHF